MTTKDDLLSLAERCVAASGPDSELSASIALAVHDWLHPVEGNKPLNCRLRNKHGSPVYIGGETGRAMNYTASLDAALTLVPDEWIVAMLEWWPMKRHAAVRLRAVRDFEAAGGWGFGYDETCAEARSADIMATPALAVCCAALRARAVSADTHPTGGDSTEIEAPASLSGAVPEGQTPSPSPSPAAGR